ncbi:hypothetical protein L226DRAFT_617398 [Lentinus tigrinus ALCF2SS1-7]|uniref:Fungal-type protein kinase domain-containing protein n=1 Tax=Lentinus tigrinus ALCF2SS1-6 TaxID=1328759 RepID=A0A5C2RQ41_9APHY|nr:hypothetical protein L227DRAFT_557675 [Lentinus tigrinus ALCF2SS1-6]RPD68688.1 hypothetical protein L226DRAFT_617398 [Lentinus tigrinus ALCF2SS1-7]
MHGKNYILPLDQFVEHFFLGSPSRSTKAITNLFAKVPEFKTEREMYDHFTFKFNGSKIFPGQKFVTTAWKSDAKDSTGQAIDCGMYPAKFAPEESQTAAGDESRRTDWSRIDLCIECKLDSTSQDPFDERKLDNSPEAVTRQKVLGQILSYAELVFRHQQRQFHYMLLLFRECARIIYFDHSSMVVTEKIPYATQGQELSEFLVRYGRLKKPEFQGHDPTAVRIEKTDDLHSLVREYAENCVTNDAEDHAAGLFRDSLVKSWPIWRLQVYDEQTETEHWFAVGKPHSQASGVAGRGTRGYVALPLLLNKNGELSVPPFNKRGEPTEPFVYLKDAWRIDHPSLQKEGLVLKALNDAEVQFVPTVFQHGDLPGQSTLSYQKWSVLRGKEDCKLKPHHHYRLTVKEVGKPLSEFDCGAHLVVAIFNCIQAHEQACKAGYIHRDISSGNILLCKSKSGKWLGMLNDWELAAKYVMGEGIQVNAASEECPVLERTGTWQFLSVNCLLDKHRIVDIPDDLESILHVLLHFAVRFLPHNIKDDSVGVFLYQYFDDYSTSYHGPTSSPAKFAAMKDGEINLTLLTGGKVVDGTPQQDLLHFYEQALPPTEEDSDTNSALPPGHPINDLLSILLGWFKGYYALSRPQPPKTNEGSHTTTRWTADIMDFAGEDPVSLAAAQAAARGSAQSTTAASTEATSAQDTRASPTVPAVKDPMAAAKITHEAFKIEFVTRLFNPSIIWPALDKCPDKRPKTLVIEKTAAATTTAKAATTGGSAAQMNFSKRKQAGGDASNKKRQRSVK